MLLDFDCHVHTYYSPCGRQTDDEGRPLADPQRHLEQAHALGLDAMIFTDHFVEDPSLPGTVLFYRSSGPAILESLRREIERSSAAEGLDLYVGCETETMSIERVGVSPEMAAQLDFVLVPTTHYHLVGVPQPDSYTPKDLADHMLTMFKSVVTKPWLDSVAHPFAEREEMIGDLRGIYDVMDKHRLDDILGLAVDNGVALEVNGSSVTSSHMPNYGAVYGEVVRRAKPLGVRFTYGSDAHDYRNLGMSSDVDAWIREYGLDRSDFWSPAELRAKRR